MSTVGLGGTAEVIHGVEVRDAYRWLEDRRLPETESWINRQQQLCDQYFLENKFYAPLVQFVHESLAVELIDQAARVGDRVFLRKQTKGQEQAAIWVRNEVEAEDRLIVDPAMLGSDISVGILRISPDASLLAYSVRSCGSDATEVRIVDVETGELLPDRLEHSYIRGFSFVAQGKGFYYCAEAANGRETLSIKHHRLGETSSSDASLFSVPWAEQRRLVLLSNCGTLAAVVTEFTGEEMVQALYLATEANNRVWTAVYAGVRGRMWPILAGGRIFRLDMEQTKNGQLIELVDGNKPPRVVVPECSNAIQRCLVTQEGFVLTYLVDRQARFERWSIDGIFQGTLVLPPGKSIEILPFCSDTSSSLFFLHESYTEAPSLLEIPLSKEQRVESLQWTVSDEKSSATTREVCYPSRDGIKIPMILLEPMNRLPGPQVVILSAYGGFGVAEVPRYSRFAKIMAEFGVTIARASVRGGAEFGKEWHQAATKRKKQTSIDDFLAAAEWLCSEGITDERHLAIMGASNGGLLVAAAVVQRPDLFEAAICTGPLTDMLRYERFDHASRWKDEYGTVEDAEDFLALLSYSPYHNVKLGVNYPAMLFVTGDADDRCNPAHVRKMVAALQEREAQRQPVIVDYSKRWGHALTLSLAERVEALDRKLAFLCEQLNITLPEGVR